MSDHSHALIPFPNVEVMSDVIGDWKRIQETDYDVTWQEGYFDHSSGSLPAGCEPTASPSIPVPRASRVRRLRFSPLYGSDEDSFADTWKKLSPKPAVSDGLYLE